LSPSAYSTPNLKDPDGDGEFAHKRREVVMSSYPEADYDKKTQAQDVARVLDVLKIEKAALVTHDIGNSSGFRKQASHSSRWVTDSSRSSR